MKYLFDVFSLIPIKEKQALLKHNVWNVWAYFIVRIS